MEYQHVQRISKSPLYVNLKKHYCPNCNSLLNKIKVSKIVNSESPEAKDLDFETLDNFMIGNVKFIWTEFKCPHCGKQISVEEMKQIEKGKLHEKP